MRLTNLTKDRQENRFTYMTPALLCMSARHVGTSADSAYRPSSRLV